MATYNGETYNNMSSEMHAEDTFEDCTFQGTARRCNFYKATFDGDCVFEEDFSFANCNLQQADGVEDTEKVECLYITEAEWQAFVQLQRFQNPHLQLEE